MNEKNWFVYVIRTRCNRLYTGITTDVKRRFMEHQATSEGISTKGAKFFRGRMPEKLVFSESFPDRSQASKREAYIKSLSKLEKEKLVVRGSSTQCRV